MACNKGNKKNAIRYLYGETNEILLPVATTKENECNEIANGDMIYFLTGAAPTSSSNQYIAKPVGALATASVGDRAKHYFAGIAMSDSRDGDSADIRVATTGIFKIPCTAATFYPGYMAVFKTGAGTGSVDVDACTPTAESGVHLDAIGRIVEKGTLATSALVQIHSAVFTGSIDFITAGEA